MAATTQHVPDAAGIFDGVAADYERPAQLFGLFQYRGWQKELASLIAAVQPELVLDMCTGTGLIAEEIRAKTKARVVGADLSHEMLRNSSPRTADPDLVRTDARLPAFRDGAFDAVVFSYLLRYVQDVPGTIAGLAALVRPGGLMASLEFGVPSGVFRPAWLAYTRAIMPAGLAVLSPGWRRVGGFLGHSIWDFNRAWPPERLEDEWRNAGIGNVETRRLSLGGAVIQWGTRS
ncbi:MAG: class I SAM-dependent methyltransferase [Dehalococcoidia bacterium]